jgi:hypothetical protein
LRQYNAVHAGLQVAGMRNQNDYWLLDRATNIDPGSAYAEFAAPQWASRIQIDNEDVPVWAIDILAKSIDSANLGTISAQIFSVPSVTAIPASTDTVCSTCSGLSARLNGLVSFWRVARSLMGDSTAGGREVASKSHI